jgi:CubicO group peptidase (beta-lactamase class C family)
MGACNGEITTTRILESCAGGDMQPIVPDETWTRERPQELGFDPDRLEKAERWLDYTLPDGGYRVLVIRFGRIAAEWIRGVEPHERRMIYSAGKSVYGNLLGMAIAEGRLASADVRVADVYPAMMDVPDGVGPKPGRFASEKDRDITFRQLISNTSGYLKPDEMPGEVFHYQTFGMNILTHAIATLYGYYDIDRDTDSPGIARLVAEKIAKPIGANFSYSYRNFDHAEGARTNIFGNYTEIETDPYDAARLGLLWLNGGRWKDKEIIPEAWLAESVRVNPDVRRISHEDMYKYGYGFWTNEAGKLFDSWDTLPKSIFSSCGAHGHFITVFPESQMVVVQNPGPYRLAGRANPGLLKLIQEAIVDNS